MQLSVKDLARLLNVKEQTIYRWVRQKDIPFYRIHDQYRFNRVEILDWATAHKVNFLPEMLEDPQGAHIREASLAETIQKGGIHYGVEGKNKKELLSAVVHLLDLPEDVNRESLLNAMLSREELGSTGFGYGIAIPHARYPIVTHISGVIVSICFSKEPVDFGAIDGKLVHCLFTLVSPTVRSHLQILSRIAFVLKDADVRDAIVHQQPPEVILKEIRRSEQAIGQAG